MTERPKSRSGRWWVARSPLQVLRDGSSHPIARRDGIDTCPIVSGEADLSAIACHCKDAIISSTIRRVVQESGRSRVSKADAGKRPTRPLVRDHAREGRHLDSTPAIPFGKRLWAAARFRIQIAVPSKHHQ